MHNKNLLFSGLILTSAMFLAGCENQPNPLLTLNISEITQVLSSAERAAMNATHMLYTSGSIYVMCMENPGNFAPFQPVSEGQKRCDDLFQAMVNSANSQPNFKYLTVADLKDPKAFQRIQDAMSDKDGG